MKRFSLLFLWLTLQSSLLSAEPLSLEDCLDMARIANPTLRQAAESPTIAEQDVRAAEGGYRPRVDLETGFTQQKDPQAVVMGGMTEQTQNREYPFLSLHARQILYDFGRTTSLVEGARAGQTAAVLSYQDLEQDIFLQTVAAYYAVLEGDHLLTAALEEVTMRKEHLDISQALFEEGVVTRNDVLQAQVELANSRLLQLSRENQLTNQWLRLNYLTGRDSQARSELEDKTDPPALPPPLNANQAVAERPGLQAQQQQVEAVQQQIIGDRSQFRPELFLDVGADYTRNDYVEEQTIYSATIGLRMNLFDGLASTARLRQSTLRLTQEKNRLQDLQRQAALAYRNARNDAEVAQQRIAVTEEAVRQGEENLRINVNRYQEQTGTATEVIDAQTLLTRTRTEHYRALFDYQVALARLRHAAGKL